MTLPEAHCGAVDRPSWALSGRHETGMALIEALVASAVLGLGLVAATRLTLHTLHTASDTRQRTVALVLASEAMDCLQSRRSGCILQTSTTVQGTDYTLSSEVQTRPGLALEDLKVRVQWPTAGPSVVTLGGNFGVLPRNQTVQPIAELTLSSSRDAVPTWHGVSLP
ncbi:MAG: hypothetical protein RJB14_2666 [Pseudomonadota bacterium]|jgi:type II secretory pathway pseudopilin PulG